ncbi:MAG TPA: acylphosphatase [Flavobacteriales bacterium]|jgi:acylphosphatase|nr:acylphosphatase [Flavobacteriales bacterium]
MKRSISARVYGKVQGVWFRASTKEIADGLEIKGIVRNENGGTVYIEAQGDEEAMKHFLEWMNEGPRHAEVERVEVNEIAQQNFTEFRITP